MLELWVNAEYPIHCLSIGQIELNCVLMLNKIA